MTIIEMPQPLGLFAGQLFDRGVEYLEAFEILSGGGVRKYHPSYFLCAHSFRAFFEILSGSKRRAESEIEGTP